MSKPATLALLIATLASSACTPSQPKINPPVSLFPPVGISMQSIDGITRKYDLTRTKPPFGIEWTEEVSARYNRVGGALLNVYIMESEIGINHVPIGDNPRTETYLKSVTFKPKPDANESDVKRIGHINFDELIVYMATGNDAYFQNNFKRS